MFINVSINIIVPYYHESFSQLLTHSKTSLTQGNGHSIYTAAYEQPYMGHWNGSISQLV